MIRNGELWRPAICRSPAPQGKEVLSGGTKENNGRLHDSEPRALSLAPAVSVYHIPLSHAASPCSSHHQESSSHVRHRSRGLLGSKAADGRHCLLLPPLSQVGWSTA